MRVPALAILAMTTALTATPAQAQIYGGNAPVCLQRFYPDGGVSIECGYSSRAQCNATASGLPAMCIDNPYFASAQVPRGSADRQPRRAR